MAYLVSDGFRMKALSLFLPVTLSIQYSKPITHAPLIIFTASVMYLQSFSSSLLSAPKNLDSFYFPDTASFQTSSLSPFLENAGTFEEKKVELAEHKQS